MNKLGWAFLGMAIVAVLASCGKRTEQTATVAPETAQHITIVAAPHEPYPPAKLKIIAPREGEVLKNSMDSVRIVMQVTGTALGVPTDADSTRGIAYAKQGQHIHVIVDDKPYMADFINGQPFNVGVLAPGLHTIRAFPSFSWHESIKSPGAFATRTFYVGKAPKGKLVTENNMDGPMLTYSRPKGTYSGTDTAKVLLDFYISNATLDTNGYHVKLWIDGTAMPDLVKWEPYYIEGFSQGTHTIKLQLVSPNGAPVAGSYNAPSEDITIE